MTENPINPAALYDYAASKNDMDSLRPEERTFLEACAWEWEKAREAKAAPAAPEKREPLRVCVECGHFSCACPAPSSPAAERADEGLEEEAERLREAYTNDEGSWLEWPDCRQEPWLRVARAARALRRGGVTEEPWGIVDDLALSGKVTDTMTAGQPARSRLRNELSAAVRERDQLAAKLAEAERALCERAEQVDKLMQERDLVMARLGNFCQPGEIEDRIRILQGHAGKMERQRDEARAEAERLRGERDSLCANDGDLFCKIMAEAGAALADAAIVGDGPFDGRHSLAMVERLAKEHKALRALGVREAEKNATPFVVDREKVMRAVYERVTTRTDYARCGWSPDAASDAAITEYERQRAEHAAKGGAS